MMPPVKGVNIPDVDRAGGRLFDSFVPRQGIAIDLKEILSNWSVCRSSGMLRLTDYKRVACDTESAPTIGAFKRKESCMSDTPKQPRTDEERRRLLGLVLAGGACASLGSAAAAAQDDDPDYSIRNPLLWAVAYKQTAAEFYALCHQAYNLARMRIDLALAQRQPGDRPLAVITDMDNTILHALSYWGHLINRDKDFFDDGIWDEWLPHNLITAVPGAIDFFDYCHGEGVEVFYVTNRDQGERTFEYALAHLRHLDFPIGSEKNLFVFRDTSDKTPARREIEETHDIALMLGDNLNDYRRDYYVRDVDERRALMERDRDDWGTKFILVPNPTDGHWVRAIFGDSEPAPTDENRRILRDAATRVAWDGSR
jgi:5'-nucleotidase (lipoprotein e(P4) family)